MSIRPSLVLSALVLAVSSCLRHERPAVELINPNIGPERFRVIATVAGESRRMDKQISATVRLRMLDSGLNAVTKAGNWGTEVEAVRGVCDSKTGAPVDGVLFVWYNRLKLSDCETLGSAYEIGGKGATMGITAMTDKLIGYLRRRPAMPS
jgi:hypothetical protein